MASMFAPMPTRGQSPTPAGGAVSPADTILAAPAPAPQSMLGQSPASNPAAGAMQMIQQISEQARTAAEQYPEASEEFDLISKALREAMIKIVSSRTQTEESAPVTGATI